MQIVWLLILGLLLINNVHAFGADRSRNYACDPTDPKWTYVVTWGTGGDFDPARGETLDDARKSIPSRDDIVLIGILGGEYNNVALPFVHNKNQVTICGLSEQRPILNANRSSISFGDIEQAAVRHLEINDGRINMSPRWASLTVEGVFLHDNPNTCIESGGDHSDWLADRGLTQSTVVLTDVEIARCGAGNIKHNIYLSSRRLNLKAQRLSSYAANESHTLKTIAEQVEIIDSYFATVADWNNPGNRDSEHWSNTLVDIAACGEVVISNTLFKTTFSIVGQDDDAIWYGSPSAIQFRARRDISGCDLPVYGSAEFNDPAFWQSVTALPITDLANNHSFKKYISNTTIEFVDFDGTRPFVGIRDDGTYPRNNVGSFSTCSSYLNVPEQWVERSVTSTGNITWQNYAENERYAFDLHECATPATKDKLPPPERSHVSVGGEEGTFTVLPSWFKPANGPIAMQEILLDDFD